MKELSREILENAGIRVEQDPYEECGYKIYRYGRKAGRAKEKTWQKLNPSLNAKYHKKSGKMNWYWIVGYSQNNEPKAYPLHRLLYAWFIGYVPANMDVDHIDGDTLNNDLSNLQLLTRKENLAKREGFKNQWDAMKANEEEDEIPDLKAGLENIDFDANDYIHWFSSMLRGESIFNNRGGENERN